MPNGDVQKILLNCFAWFTKKFIRCIIVSRVSKNSNKAKVADGMSFSCELHQVHGALVAGTHLVMSIARVHAVDRFTVSGGDVDSMSTTNFAAGDDTKRGVDCGFWDFSLT